MQPQTELIQRVLQQVKSCELFTQPIIGALPQGNGIAVQLAGGFDEAKYFDRNTLRVITLELLCRHQDHSIAYDTLFAIENKLTSQTAYPVSGEQYEWLKTEMFDSVKLVTDSTENDIYSAVLHISAYI